MAEKLDERLSNEVGHARLGSNQVDHRPEREAQRDAQYNQYLKLTQFGSFDEMPIMNDSFHSTV